MIFSKDYLRYYGLKCVIISLTIYLAVNIQHFGIIRQGLILAFFFLGLFFIIPVEISIFKSLCKRSKNK